MLYGLTPADIANLRTRQANVCPICSRSLTAGRRSEHVDHDHRDGTIRGLLCGDCNIGIGHFFDNPALMRSAADYIEMHNVAKMLAA